MTVLFSKELLGTAIQQKLGSDFVIRPLESSDYEKGFLEALSHLTVVDVTSKNAFIGTLKFKLQNALHILRHITTNTIRLSLKI